MKPGPYHHLAALVRQKRERYMADASYHSHMSQRLTAYLKESHAKTLETVKLHGWWEYDTAEEVREVVLEELYELIDAWKRWDYHSPHGIRAESPDVMAVICKSILWMDDQAEKGKI